MKVFWDFKSSLDLKYVQEKKYFFSDLKNPISWHQRKSKKQNTRQITKSHEFPE